MSRVTRIASAATVPLRLDVVSAPKQTEPRVTEARVIFGASLICYLTVGALLVFRYDSIPRDAIARVANAYVVLHSRDPKLAAVGFVWMPLPSLLQVPFLQLRALWPALATRGFIANIESALFMAGSVVLLRGILADLRVSTVARLTLVVLFALNPMILHYGANGMTEALMVFFLLAAVRPLARWMREPRSRELAIAGAALALGYFARYEVLASGVAAAALVAALTFLRHRRERGTRVHLAVADLVLVGLPVSLVAALWAAASWLVVGHPFDTFTSRYGNTAQVELAQHGIAETVGGRGLPALEYAGRQLLVLVPAIGLVLLVVMVTAWRRRDPWLLAPVTVLGAVLAFQAISLAEGGTFGWLRFQISAIPLMALLIGYLLSPNLRRGTARMPSSPRTRRRTSAALAGIVAFVLMGAGTVTTAVAFNDPALAREEWVDLMPVVQRLAGDRRPIVGNLHVLTGEREIARYLDRRRLSDGSVLVDLALGFPIVLASSRPHQFVITPDRDFEQAVANPAGTGIRYVLTSADTGTMDAVATRFPSLFASGAGFATLVREFRPPYNNGRTWRLFRVHPSNPRS